MIEKLNPFLPLVLIFVAIACLARYQMRQYSAHVAQVNAINPEILSSNREMTAELKELNRTLKERG